MVSNNTLIEIASSWWKWIVKCWLIRRSVLESAKNFECEKDVTRRLRIELDLLESKANEIQEKSDLARDGNRALLRFIHARNQIAVRATPDGIQEMK